MHLFTQSETYQDGISIWSSTINMVGKAADLDVTTYSGTSATPSSLGGIHIDVIFDFKTQVTLDSFWFLSDNVSKFRLLYSDNPTIGGTGVPATSTFTLFDTFDGNTDGRNFRYALDPAPPASRYWSIDITEQVDDNESVLFYEILMMTHLLTIDDINDQPSSYQRSIDDEGGATYRLANEHLISYQGIGGPKETLTLGWEYMDAERIRTNMELEDSGMGDQVEELLSINLDRIWRGPPKKPIMTVYPRPVDYPDIFYQMWWSDDYDEQPAGENLLQGSNLTMTLIEQ